MSALQGNDNDSDSSDDEGLGRDRSSAMVFDRSLVGDRNGLKTAILRSVYENQIHLQARKGEAFDNLAERLSQTEEFKQYKVHGRKLQKSFNKIARDIKDCIVAGNEPSRWGKEEPEFFRVARKIFDEARRAGIRAFDEKLKSKTIEDRLHEGENKSSTGSNVNDDHNRKKAKKRDFEAAGLAAQSSSNPIMGMGMFDPNSGEWTRIVEEYLDQKLESIKAEISSNLASKNNKIPRTELEAGIHRSVEQLASIGIKSIHDILIQAGVSDAGRAKITENCGFQANDEVSIFLLSYTDAISKDTHPVSGIREQFDNISARDASVLYSFIGKVTK